MTLRIAHLLDGKHFGGAEQIVRRLAKGAASTGVEARVYCFDAGRLSDYLAGDGVAYRVFVKRPKLSASLIGDLTAALAEDEIQIVQAHTSRAHFYARLVSRRLGIKNITTIQAPVALDENRGTRRHPLRALIERAGRPWTDSICVVSREERERMVREEGVAPKLITSIPNGVADPWVENVRATDRPGELISVLKSNGLAQDAFVIAMVASFRPRKGAETLIDAFAKFRSAGMKRDALLLMIGDAEFAEPEYLDKLQAYARHAGVLHHTEFAGFQDDPWALARGADVISLPSLFGEGLPLVLTEAMAHGLPIVVSDTAGNRECVELDPDNADREVRSVGWSHVPGDVADLAGQLIAAASDPARLKESGEAARARFLERYELNRVLAQWRELYESLAADRSD